MKAGQENIIRIIFTNMVFVLLSAVLGLLCVVLPPYIIPNGIKVDYSAPLFPFIATAIKNFAFYPTMIALFVFWFVFGYVKPRIWWLLGLSAMSLFPVATILETMHSPTSHNLWPFELIEDVINAIPAVIGAFIGSRFRRRLLRKSLRKEGQRPSPGKTTSVK